MKHIKKWTALVLAMVLLCTMSASAFAAGVPSEKEEVIYIITDAKGDVESVNAVNIFGSGSITDYGTYSAVKMLTTNDEITQSGDTITFSTAANKAYYQGTLENVQIPWNISIRYFLGGKEYSASEIAGKSGDLEIRFAITENKKYSGDFFENYALQATVVLDTDSCKNIVAADATIANVGANKQLAYTILPGKGMETTIRTTVEDFTMEAISINAIQLNLNVEIDDATLMEKVDELIDATKKLNDGSKDLTSGTTELKAGSNTLKDGVGSLNSGAKELDDGIEALQAGVATMQGGLTELSSHSPDLKNGSADVLAALSLIQSNLNGISTDTSQIVKITEASSAVKQGINNLYDGVSLLQQNLGYTQYKAAMAENGLDIDTLMAGNVQAVSSISAQINDLQQALSQIENIPGYEAQAETLNQQIASLQSIVPLLMGNSAAMGGTEAYLNTLAGGVNDLQSGVAELKTQYEEFDKAISTLAGELTKLTAGMSELSAGINTLVSKYSELNTGISDYTDGVASIVAGYSELTDGVSNLAAGSKKLFSGVGELSAGANDLYNGVIELCDGAGELSEGTTKLYENTENMDTQVQEEIDTILASLGGDNVEPTSFVSNKNTNVKAVQFVIKTASIEKSEVVSEDKAVAAPLTFWQKLLRLFGVK